MQMEGSSKTPLSTSTVLSVTCQKTEI